MRYHGVLSWQEAAAVAVHRERAHDTRMTPRLRKLGALAAALLVTCLAGCSHRTSVPPGTIAFLGDSITAGYGLDAGQAYPALVRIPGMTMLNLGVSGSTSADGLERLQAYLGAGNSPSLVVLALGANDILHGGSPAEMKSNLHGAIRLCREHGVPILLCGVKIPFKFESASLFEEVAHEERVPLLPDILDGAAFHAELMQDDHMHPTAEGQQRIARVVQEELLRDFSFGR